MCIFSSNIPSFWMVFILFMSVWFSIRKVYYNSLNYSPIGSIFRLPPDFLYNTLTNIYVHTSFFHPGDFFCMTAYYRRQRVNTQVNTVPFLFYKVNRLHTFKTFISLKTLYTVMS